MDDERPPFADADVEQADPDLVLQLDGADDDDDAAGADDDFSPGAESEVEEEFDEGDAERDDERPVRYLVITPSRDDERPVPSLTSKYSHSNYTQ